MHNALSGYSLAPTDPRIAFWQQPETWPDDCNGYVFAARAILDLGRALYCEAWSHEAPATDLVWELPRALTLFTPLEDVRRAVALLERSETSYAKRRPRLSLLSLGPDVFPTDAEWAEAVELAKSEADRSWERYFPYADVCNRLAAASKQDLLRTATRPIEGGPLNVKEWHFWNSERLSIRFATCRVDEANPFSRVIVREGGAWLFLERSSFTALLAGKNEKSVSIPTSEATLKETARRGRRRGRPPIHDWEAYAIQFGKMIRGGEITADTAASSIARKLLDWACLRWDLLPECSTVEDKIREWNDSSQITVE